MTKLLLWTIGNKVEKDVPSERFKIKLGKIITLYKQNVSNYDEIEIIVSGRWANTVDDFLKTEARIGKEYICNRIKETTVLEENISVDLIGNFAFSKKLIINRKPDKVIAVIQ